MEGSVRRKKRNDWRSEAHCKEFLDSLGASHGVDLVTGAGWDRVSVADVRKAGGGALLQRRGPGLRKLLLSVYPDADLDGQRFGSGSRNVRSKWTNVEERRAFLTAVAQKFGVQKAEDWKRVTTKAVHAEGGTALLAQYSNSLALALKATFPDLKGLPDFVFRPNVSRGYWSLRANRHAFLAHAAESLGLCCGEDWRRVSQEQLQELGGSGLLHRHSGSLLSMLQQAGEEGFGFGTVGVGDVWECRPNVPAHYWEEEKNVVRFVRHLEQVYAVRNKEDWYRLSYRHLAAANGSGLLRVMDLADALWLAFPHEKWDRANFVSSSKKSSQRQLAFALSHIFARQHVQLEPSHGHGTAL